jgi:ubiquinone/menaquinone biosynthesis C-methylase UbiE
MQPDREVMSRWSASAPFWEKHRDVIRHMFAPVTDALIETIELGGQDVVLDVATGPGEPALTVAATVGPNGKIFGIDPVPDMVAAARREADRRGLANAQFDVGFADHLPFPAHTFDAAISRFGVMFFPSPAESVREMLRVLKPGRKLALAVWHFADRNPFHYTLFRAVEPYIGLAPTAPDAPDAFRFAAPGRLREVINDAGALASTERLLQFTIEAPISAEEFWKLRREMSDKLRDKIAMLSEEQMTEVTRRALESLQEYSTDKGMRFPAEVIIVSGTKSWEA